ncbi:MULTISPECIES: CrcB family protein [unclassified Halomonas]|uniref:fluoride efflux transporter FluC n=1 Tax=unclassified Halomonas TaxID=2609666 RepID=UPI00209FACBE|nr:MULTISPECIES: CrcB family protein [unclassified Halomonas]MCP1313235.1 CrcB family protein [Halomonas sp. 707D7]MCP1326115.1 CrcB family protein [Halomonas sp. 707D4]
MGEGFVHLGLLALGAGLGGMARLGVTHLADRLWGARFPWGTLIVNASGAFVAGLLLGRFGIDALADSPLGLYMITGVLGGYTTVSSLSLQTLSLWQAQRHLAAIANLAGSVALGVALALLGWLWGGAA